MQMEVVIYGILTTVWWLSSASVLLPFLLLLKFNQSFRNRWFSFFFMKLLGPVFGPSVKFLRKRPFDLLKEHLNLRNDKSAPVEVLEIGIGGGDNLQFYPENTNLTALDMNATFDSYLRENQKKFPHVTYKRTIHAKAEDMKEVQDASMDIVVCTYVLCSVENIGSVLAEVKRVLKPGGKFLFLEHVVYPSSEWAATIQRLVSPLWVIYFDGCIPDRDIASEIHRVGFSDVQIENSFPNSAILYVRPTICGIATK